MESLDISRIFRNNYYKQSIADPKKNQAKWMKIISCVPPRYLVIVLLAVLILSVYWQVGSHTFVLYDDPQYVYKNSTVLQGLTRESISWAFTTFHAANWHPLTWLSHMADVELFGTSAGSHLRMNVLYHLLNTELLFLVLWQMTGGLWQSAFVAVLFGVHPLHVESVAWIAERKDVLSTLFWIVTMGAYLRYVRRPNFQRYSPVVIFFALGLMCKPMLVTLPFVLLLLDWWPLKRYRGQDSSISFPLTTNRLILEKLPLLAMSTISCVLTYLAQSAGEAVSSLKIIPFGLRASNAIVSYLAYLEKAIWPSGLAVLYPHPAITNTAVPIWKIAGALLILCAISYFVLRVGRRHPFIPVGWLWYLGTLFPVIGFVQVGSQAMADRYTYVPLIGIFIAMAWGIPNLVEEWRFRRLALGVLVVAVIAFSAVAWNQVGYWRNSITLFSRALAVTENNLYASNNLGGYYIEIGEPQKAIFHYQEAVRIDPDYADAWNNLGVAYDTLGQSLQAISYYQKALQIEPRLSSAWNNLGAAYYTLRQPQRAIICYQEALRIEPDFADAWNNLGMAYDYLGQPRQAIMHYQKALQIKPGFTSAQNNLRSAYDNLSNIR